MSQKSIVAQKLNFNHIASPVGSLEQQISENQMPSPIAYEWLTTDQAAAYLNMSPGNLRNETSNGNIPFYKLGRRNRYLKSELTQLLLSSRKGGIYGNKV